MAYYKKNSQPLAEIVSGLMTPSCRQRGVANSALLLDPVELFGEKLARTATVERVVWPRGSRIDQGSSTGATLVISADPGSALMLQHVAPQVIERANLIIGWPAISRLKVTQATRRARKPAPPPRPVLDPAAVQRLSESMPDIEDRGLRDALARLGAGIARRRADR
ncbi:DciA family protein [Acuticoccus sp. MNP-M23]|uniref:DUF721 domain-containing protein n=1 Tax=Acuticoccus sp. MNP-M23 TaxID=3072793 RepID=UPI0028166CF0|nr:DciA family protein [Acuticoccus sp. MNP-M23]WMS43362.1 DciA family protein [Acuticoccus sp. MNP-M23]